MRYGLVVALLAVLLVVGTAGCQGRPVVTVLAAASLTESFDEIVAAYEKANPGVTVRVSYGSSATLAAQITSGAPADVFASANASTMASLARAGIEVRPRTLATNVLQIAVPPGNPAGVAGLADFARPELRIALCDEDVPCGSAARQLLAELGITPRADTLEVDVKATLNKVQLGEVDAALVYRTDVVAAGPRVQGLPTPGAERVVNTYQVASLPQAPDRAAAEAFVGYLLSPVGQETMRRYGFGS